MAQVVPPEDSEPGSDLLAAAHSAADAARGEGLKGTGKTWIIGNARANTSALSTPTFTSTKTRMKAHDLDKLA